jgi:hypothetical protein
MSVTNKLKAFYKLPNYLLVFILLFGSLVISSCNDQARGFALPEGDIEKGKENFERFTCNECHSISGIAWKGGSDSLKILLGGATTVQKSYGDLVTSVINPSHKIARSYIKQTTALTTEEGLSKMKIYNEVMTVQELIDLVAFLQSEYKVTTPPTEYYPYHY